MQRKVSLSPAVLDIQLELKMVLPLSAIDLKITRPWTRFNWGTLKADIDLNALAALLSVGKTSAGFYKHETSTRLGEVKWSNKTQLTNKETTKRKRK